jgi:multisubunit Na+/H+ antiporter MnhB subunit
MLYATAWMVIGASAVIGAYCLNLLIKGTRRSRAGSPRKLRYIFVALVFFFFLIPAPLPNYPEVFAPAFVVFIFEFLFQSNGSPNESRNILIVGLAAVGLIGLFFTLCIQVKAQITGRRRKSSLTAWLHELPMLH